MFEITNPRLTESIKPMLDILDKKNVTSGINVIEENNKVYITFDKSYLSETNQEILETISSIYSETLFYSDNQEHPIQDKLELWCPDDEYAERTHIRERCKSKRLFVLVLDLSESLEFVGTTIMLANVLQEQDPLSLKANENISIIDADMSERHEHYVAAELNDSDWFNLSVSLNRNNPLCENPYAPFMTMRELNSPVSCDNILTTALVGFKEKKYITFCTDEKELASAIESYFNPKSEDKEEPEIRSTKIDGVKQIQLIDKSK